MNTTSAIFRAKYTSHFFDLLSGERGKCNSSTLSSAGTLIIFIRTSISKLQDKGKKEKNPNNLAQKALLRLHSSAFVTNNKSNFMAW